MSKQRPTKALIDQWVNANKPDGIRKLAEAAGISSNSLSKIRQGRSLKDQDMRQRLASVLGVKESELFPAPTGKSRAS